MLPQTLLLPKVARGWEQGGAGAPATEEEQVPLPLLVLGSQHLSRWCSQGRPAAPVIHDLVSLGPASAFTELWLRIPHPRHGHLATGNHSGHFWVLCVSLEYRGHRGKLRSSLSFHLTTRFHLVKCASQPKRLLLEP